MLHSLRFRLLVVLMTIVMVVVGSVALFTSRVTVHEFQNYVDLDMKRNMERNRRLMETMQTYYNEHQDEDSPSKAKNLAQILGERVIIADSRGQVLGDSSGVLQGKVLDWQTPVPAVVVISGQTPFIEPSLQKGTVLEFDVLQKPEVLQAPLSLAIRPMNGFGPIENGFISAVNGALILAVTVAGVVALLLTVVFSRRILEPIESLTAAARKMENGDLSQRVSVRSKDEIGTLTHAFNAMADGLARLENLRRNMVTDVAHELRTPLTNIRGYLEALRDGMIQPGPALINSLHEEAMLLNRLIDDLQELALAEAGQLRLVRQMVDIREIIEQAVSAQQPSMAEKGLKVSVDLPPNLPLVEADAERIGQVLRNLLNNASVHTPANGEVRVTVQLVDAEVVVSVRDTGSGIPPTHLPYIFERFYRADKSRTRATGGAGLGLAIVKQLIEAHGGRIWAESTEGSGSVFTFTLLAPEHRVTALDWKGSLLKQRA